MSSKVLLLNGPNLELLGTREPERYGRVTLAELEASLLDHARTLGIELACFQSSSEAALIERIHDAAHDGTCFAIANLAAYTHTSIALRDALLAVALPFIEVHVTNVHRREPFRHHSYVADIAVGTITGLGTDGYRFALEAAATRLGTSRRADA